MTTPPLDCDLFQTMLPEYLEDGLDADDRAAVDAHAASCARCAALRADLSALARDARALPDRTPSHDLWPAIAARLDTPVVQLPVGPAAPRAAAPARRRARTVPWLAAAAVLLVAATASVTVVATRAWNASTAGPALARHDAPSAGVTTPDARSAAPARVVPASAHTAVPVERIYDHEIAQLDSIVHDRRSQLDSTTIAVVEKNLAIIDQAIAQSRAALARDPNSRFLHDQLNDALDQKVSLLRTAALLPART